MVIIPFHVAVGITAALRCVVRNIHRELLSVFLCRFFSNSWFCIISINSLKDSKKHNSRRSNKNNQQISIITSDSTAINAHPSQIQMQQQQQQPHYDNRMNTQVKTYTDHGNGHSVMRTGNSSHYSKVRLFFCVHKTNEK